MPRRGARASAMKCSTDDLGGLIPWEGGCKAAEFTLLGADEGVCPYASQCES
jgi:hypothetical protein